VDFAISEGKRLTHLVVCKLSDDKPHRALLRFASEQGPVQSVQVVRNVRHAFVAGAVQVVSAPAYLRGLAA
jgi:hypothetical protein